jgi:tetratricopeptide (TPR) repeat protein
MASRIASWALAAIAITLAYANFFHNSFHFDDSHVIESNVYIRSLANVPKFFSDAHTFSSLPQNSTYRPLVTLSYALDYHFGGGLNPVAFHVTQMVLLLILGALLMVFYGRITNQTIALAAATIFCVHTANTETMNFLSSRSELISAIGVILAFILWQRGSRAAYLIPLAIGALAKAPVVVFGPLLFAYAKIVGKKSWREALKAALPSTILGIVLLVLLGRMNAPEWTSGGGSAYRYAISQPFIWFHYVRLFFFPIGLTADSDWQPFESIFDTRAMAGFLFAIALIAFARMLTKRDDTRVAAFGIAWFFIALIPASSFFPLAEVTNEHRLFFPFIGLTLAVLSLLPQKALVPVCVAAVIALGVGTYQRNKVWRTEETLWADVIVKSPNNGRAWMNYGLTQMEKGSLVAARDSFSRAALLTPNYSTLEINRGIVEGALGHADEAEPHFRRALELVNDAYGHYFYGRWLVDAGRGAEAEPHLREALRMSPAYAANRALLIRLLYARDAADAKSLNDDTKVIDAASALTIPKRTYDEHFRAGLALIQQRRFLDAAIENRSALAIDATSPDALNNLGWALGQMGYIEEAKRAFRRALELRPGDVLAQNNLRWASTH